MTNAELEARIAELEVENARLSKQAADWRMRWEKQHQNTLRWMESCSKATEQVRQIKKIVASG